MMLRKLFAVPALLGFGLAACSDLAAPAENAAPQSAEAASAGDPAAEALAAAEAFLAENGARDGVTTTASGLQFEVLEAGPKDAPSPAATSLVCVHYKGTLLDGTEFDSSYSRGAPALFPANRLIDGWVEALSLMRAGDAWRLFIHPDLGYGARGSGRSIGPNAALIFDMSLLRVWNEEPPAWLSDCSLDPEADPRAEAAKAAGDAFLAQNAKKPGVEVTASGLQIEVVKSGDAAGPTPQPGQFVCVHYKGALIDGTEFDSSYQRGQPTAFPSDRLIKGWVEALARMRAGDAWRLAIPSDIAYGLNGAGDVIGPNETLVFDVELLKLLDGPVAPDQDCSKE